MEVCKCACLQCLGEMRGKRDKSCENKAEINSGKSKNQMCTCVCTYMLDISACQTCARKISTGLCSSLYVLNKTERGRYIYLFSRITVKLQQVPSIICSAAPQITPLMSLINLINYTSWKLPGCHRIVDLICEVNERDSPSTPGFKCHKHSNTHVSAAGYHASTWQVQVRVLFLTPLSSMASTTRNANVS